MRKIFTLFSALLLTVSMWATIYNYKCGPTAVTVKDQSTSSYNQFEISITQDAKNTTEYNKQKLYPSTVTLIIYPETRSIAGTFSTNDYSIGPGSYVLYDGAKRFVKETGSTFTIESKGGNKYAITGGKLVVENGTGSNTYNYSYCYANADLNDQYASATPFEFTYGVNTYNFDSYITTDVTVTDNYATSGYYILDFKQQGTEREETPSVGNGTSTVQLKIFPESESLVGTFKVSENTLSSGSYVKSSKNDMRYCQNDAYITITKDEYDVYTISGALLTKNSAGNYFNYYLSASTFTLPDPYATEPDKVAAGLSLETDVLSANYQSGTILFNLGDYSAGAKLAFTANSNAQPAANTYSVAASGTGVFLASSGKTSSIQPSYFWVSEDGWTEDDYFIVSGSLTISYSADNKKMTIEGTVTSAHGTEITISATGANPWGPKPEINVSVTSIASKLNGTTLTLTVTGTPSGKLILFGAGDIIGEYGYDPNSLNNQIDFSTYLGYNYMDPTDYSSAVITAGQDANSYVLNASLACEDGKIYIIEDAEFTYAPPTPWDSEPAKKADGITFATTFMYEPSFNAGVLTLQLEDDDWNSVKLAIPAAENKLVAGTYTINDTKAIGTIIASPGMGEYAPEPSALTMYEGWDPYDYFFRFGSLTIGFSADNKKMTITGDAYTFRETKVTFNVEVDNPYYKGEATLDVTSITPNMGATDYITFGIEASGTGILSGAALTVKGTELVGDFDTDDLNLELSWVGQGQTSTYLDATKANSVKVTQNGFEYTLDATVFGANGSTYKMNGSFVIAELDEEEDNSALLTAAMGQTADVTIKRIFVAGTWQTICLPFDVANVAESPLAGATVKSVTNCSLEGETLLVEAEDVTSMTAGMPYLIMWENGAPLTDKFIFEDATIAAATGATSSNFVANMSAKHYVDVANKYMVVAENGLAPMGTEGSVKGFRAYFQINAPAGVALRKFAFSKNGATGTETPAAAMKANKVLKKNQLMLLYGNKVYNAQAQELK
ncbi:MAG: hypothetical protein MJZ65_06095 [Paludibacteraceae bacterium]|nr:hypothetical protein [Paludibacteraceae bacterium]